MKLEKACRICVMPYLCHARACDLRDIMCMQVEEEAVEGQAALPLQLAVPPQTEGRGAPHPPLVGASHSIAPCG